MTLRQISDGPCRTYLLTSPRAREAVLVDPVLERVEDYLRQLSREGLSLRCVIDTHTHADHLSGCAALRDRTDAAYLMHRAAPAPCVTRRLEDGETLGLGELSVRFLHTPGHTGDSLTLLVGDRLLTGDFLFIGSSGAGRLDLPGSDPAVHFDSLSKLDTIPDETVVLPAHDYQGRLESTLGTERASNPVLTPRGRDAYVQWWSRRDLGPPDWMLRVVEANAACTRDPRAVPIPKDLQAGACAAAGPCSPSAPQISPKDLALQIHQAPGSAVILDVRTPEEFTGELGHIQGAVLIPIDELPDRLAEVPPGPVVAICRSGKRAARAAQLLKEEGRDEVRVLAGGMLSWNEEGLPLAR